LIFTRPLQRLSLIGLAVLAACDAPQVVAPDKVADERPFTVRKTTHQPVAQSTAGISVDPSLFLSEQSPQASPRIDTRAAPRVLLNTGVQSFEVTTASTVAAESPSIVWARANTGGASVWKMTGGTPEGRQADPMTLGGSWRLAGSADLNRDTHPDLIWENTANGARVVVFMEGTKFNGHYAVIGVVSPAWRIAAIADMNADGNPDIIYSDDATGDHSVWFLSGAVYSGSSAALINIGTAWRLGTVADLNGDGRPDLVWEHVVNGWRIVTYMNGVTFAGTYTAFASLETGWQITAAGDFNGDASPDLVLQHTNGLKVILFMNGATWGGGYSFVASSPPGDRIVGTAAFEWGATKTAFLRLITFGDSNTDLGIQGTDPVYKATSYVSNAPEPPDSRRLGPGDPNNPLQLAGKIETRWRTARSEVIRVVNHGVVASTTGQGRTFRSSPNALEIVNGYTRFEGEVLGRGFPWSGGETAGTAFPAGSVARVNAFTPDARDYVYVSFGTNDVIEMPVAQIIANFGTMVDFWTGAGLPASHFIITTVAPRDPANSSGIPALNQAIRSFASSRGLRVIELANFTSANDGLTWRRSNMYVTNYELHFAEEVRDWLADRVMEIISQ
jgi:hypothetical protein